MPLLKPETKRLVQVAIKLIPIGINYRRDRREIRKAEGRLLDPEKYRKHATKAVNTFVQLGPAYIKLGQLLSVRPDILPQPYIDEFTKLQDEVPPAPFEEARPIVENNLGKQISEVFDSFDTFAVTGASLGQVYRAIYHGKSVVVKVNRPGIREKIAVDTKVLKRLVPIVGRFIDRALEFSVGSVIDQFSDTIKEEMDYKFEAKSLLKIRKNLSLEKNVLIPDIYPEISTEQVLVMDYLEGIKVSDVKQLDAAGVDRKKLARSIAKLFFQMLLSQDLFHADPHPGNISIATAATADGKRSTKIILYDFGMTGTLDTQTRLGLIRFYTALVDYNAEKVVDVMIELGLLQPNTNRYVIRRGVELALADMHGQKVEETEVKALMEVANRTIYQFPFRLPKNLVLYMRMLSILEGVCLALDPTFRFVKILGNLMESEGLVSEAYREELKQAVFKFVKALDATIDVAPLLKAFLEQNYDPMGAKASSSKRRGSGYGWGVLTGLGITGVAISSYYFSTLDGKLGLAGSLALLIVSLIVGRS